MTIQEFGLAILEYFIANIPSIVVIFGFLYNNTKKLKDGLSSFDLSVLKSETKIVDKVENKVKDVVEMVEDKLSKTIDKVDETLDKIGDTVDKFGNELVLLKNQVEHLFKTNKVAFEIINLLISKDEESIKNGVSSIIVDKINETKENLEKYPETISTNTNVFAKALKEQYVLLGKENFEKLIMDTLMEIGYGKEEEEL